MLSAACTRPLPPRKLSLCKGMMKLERSVSMAATSLSASIAAHASAPSFPPPNARKAPPQRFRSASSVFSESGSASHSSTTARASPGFPANCRSTTPDTAGSPVVVYAGGCKLRLVMPYSSKVAAFLGALPSRPPASHAIHSGLTIAKAFFFSTPGLSRFLCAAPAKSSCRTWMPEPTFMCSAAGHLDTAHARKYSSAFFLSASACVSARARCSLSTNMPALSMSVSTSANSRR
mmetsp:Transcript_12302/g.51478  ORF Transcript_12302/g.51478 Transcript_12302/m.51478 type:complete len:234 (-) Transcript_12302:536-1237(-)